MPVHPDLVEAFESRADGVEAGTAPLVGIFGEGVPLPLVVALGGRTLDIKAPPLADATDGPTSDLVAAIAEPFLDTFAARFLHRLAAGAFDRFTSLIFARDDTAALAAYQYATELRRQGKLPKRGPEFHLWNLLHTTSPAAETFNRAELARLTAHLESALGAELAPDRLAEAVAAEERRGRAVRSLPPGGPDAFVALNAGRWLTPDAHAALLAVDPQPGEPKIALTGTACDIPVLHALCVEVGQVVADLQDYGRRVPQPNAADLLEEIVHDPMSPRAAPPARFTNALADGIAGADLVIATTDRNDDCFGWELPGLRRAAEAQGAGFVDLGFRPFRPDEAWQGMARARIAEALA